MSTSVDAGAENVSVHAHRLQSSLVYTGDMYNTTVSI